MEPSIVDKKRIRRSFGKIKNVTTLPNLIEVQKRSFDNFLQLGVEPTERLDHGLHDVFKTVFPVNDYTERATVDYISYDFGQPKYDVTECSHRGMTFGVPLKATFRLTVWDLNEELGTKSVRDIKEQEVYMCDIPLMTKNGTFIINGVERVVVSQ
ncbi:MAG: DNA-directed RNA polymerase subunit beta, partial [Alphaproteobacteria bacterium MarineAlpha5_Bin11]